MFSFSDDDRPKKRQVHEIGQDLGTLSVEDIDERIDMLHSEIERLRSSRAAKTQQKAAADMFFKAP